VEKPQCPVGPIGLTEHREEHDDDHQGKERGEQQDHDVLRDRRALDQPREPGQRTDQQQHVFNPPLKKQDLRRAAQFARTIHLSGAKTPRPEGRGSPPLFLSVVAGLDP
jgi:hypothetical protein